MLKTEPPPYLPVKLKELELGVDEGYEMEIEQDGGEVCDEKEGGWSTLDTPVETLSRQPRIFSTKNRRKFADAKISRQNRARPSKLSQSLVDRGKKNKCIENKGQQY